MVNVSERQNGDSGLTGHVSVAVITRTKERPILLERAIKSVMQQSYEDLEMIIVNDGGSPGPVDQLVDRLSGISRGRIRVIHNPVSAGMEAASNIGIKSSLSTFVAIHDDDDSWHPSFLEETVRYLEDTGLSGVVANTNRIVESIENGHIRTESADRFMPNITRLNLFQMMGGNTFPPIAFLYRRSVYDVVGVYDETLPVLGDWEFNLRFFSKFDIGMVDRVLAYYHHRMDASGHDGNSVIAHGHKHEEYRNIILNRMLRADLESGSLGLGFMTNLLHFGVNARNIHDAVPPGPLTRATNHLRYAQTPPARAARSVRQFDKRVRRKVHAVWYSRGAGA